MLLWVLISAEGKPCINWESKTLEIKIYLYLCYDEHEAPRSYNTTVYLSIWKQLVMDIVNIGQYDTFSCINAVASFVDYYNRVNNE